jgi:death-on-curing protein
VTKYLDLADYLLIAEAVTGMPAETLARLPRLDLAESAIHAPQAEFGGVEFYPDFITKAAVLCARLLKNHPLPDGNKRAAWVSLQEFIERNGYAWDAPSVDEAEAAVLAVASSAMDEEQFAQWLRPRISCSE